MAVFVGEVVARMKGNHLRYRLNEYFGKEITINCRPRGVKNPNLVPFLAGLINVFDSRSSSEWHQPFDAIQMSLLDALNFAASGNVSVRFKNNVNDSLTRIRNDRLRDVIITRKYFYNRQFHFPTCEQIVESDRPDCDDREFFHAPGQPPGGVDRGRSIARPETGRDFRKPLHLFIAAVSA